MDQLPPDALAVMSATPNVQLSPENTLVQPFSGENTDFRHRVGSISRQSAVYFSGTILSAAAGYFFKLYLARALGPEVLGLYALGMSVVGFLGLFNALGLPSAAARFVAEYSSKGDFPRLAGFLRGSLGLLSAGNLLLGAAVVIAGPWIAVRFYHAPDLGAYFLPLSLIMLLGVLNTFLGQTMAGYRDVARRTVITHFVGKPANIIVAVAFISAGFGLFGYLVAQVASALLVLVLLAVSVWRSTPVEARTAKSVAPLDRQVVNFSAVAFGIASVHFVLGQADKVVLGYYLNPRQVGIYAVATTVVSFVPIVLQSVNQIFSPMIAELHAVDNFSMLQRLYTILTRWILIFTIPLAFSVIAFSGAVMGLFGHGFESGAAVLTIGAVGQLFNCAVGSVGFLLLMSGHQVKLIRIQAANAVLMIALTLLLVKPFGIVGAAWAASITVAVTNLWALVVVSRTLKLFPYDASYLKLVWPTILCGAVLLGLRQLLPFAHSSWRIAMLALVCAYAVFFATLLISGPDAEDRKLAEVAWNRIGLYIRGGGL